MRTVRALDLHNCALDREMLETLAGAALPALDTLQIAWNPHIGKGGFQAVAGALWAARLQTLDVDSTGISDAILLDALSSFPRLNALIIDNVEARVLPGWVFDPDFEIVIGRWLHEQLDWSATGPDWSATVLTGGAFRRLADAGAALP